MFFRSVIALCDLVCKGSVLSAACLLYCHYLIKWMLLEVKPVVTLSYLLDMKFISNPYCIKEIVYTGWSFPIDNVDKKTLRFLLLTLFGCMPSVVSCTLSVPPLPNFCLHTLYSSHHLLHLPLFHLTSFSLPAFIFLFPQLHCLSFCAKRGWMECKLKGKRLEWVWELKMRGKGWKENRERVQGECRRR